MTKLDIGNYSSSKFTRRGVGGLQAANFSLEIFGGLDVAAALLGGYLWGRGGGRVRRPGIWRHSRLSHQHIPLYLFRPSVGAVRHIVFVSEGPLAVVRAGSGFGRRLAVSAPCLSCRLCKYWISQRGRSDRQCRARYILPPLDLKASMLVDARRLELHPAPGPSCP